MNSEYFDSFSIHLEVIDVFLFVHELLGSTLHTKFTCSMYACSYIDFFSKKHSKICHFAWNFFSKLSCSRIKNREMNQGHFSKPILELLMHCPGWKNMAAQPWSCHHHTMIMAKHGHDRAMITAWRPCFLAWSSWFTAWSWYDPHVFHVFLSKKNYCLSMFPQVVAAIYLYMAHLSGFRGYYASSKKIGLVTTGKANKKYLPELKLPPKNKLTSKHTPKIIEKLRPRKILKVAKLPKTR